MTSADVPRRQARERALEVLYEATLKGRSVPEIIAEHPLPLDPYAERLARSADEQRSDLEARVASVLEGWTLERLAVIDRLVLVLALAELSWPDAPPRAVVLNEAVELVRTYSTDASPSFVNGVLVGCLAAGD